MKRLFQSHWRKLAPALFVATLLGVGNAATAQVEPVTVIHKFSGANNDPLVIPATIASAPLDYLVTGSYSGTNPIIIRSGFNGTVTLNGVTLLSKVQNTTLAVLQNGNAGNAIDIENGARVTLKLMGTNTLLEPTATNANDDWLPANLHVAANAYLTIESYDGIDTHGTLISTANRRRSGAAIGGNMNSQNMATASISGHITINSGTVIATGGDDSAGIGGSSFGGAGGHITITGGIVRATCDATGGGSNSGAAIGSGYACRNRETYITITGGNVTAVSLIKNDYALCGAAIGAGNASTYTTTNEGNFGYILITGGTIKASVRGRYALDGTYSGNTYWGRDGVAIGGGARAAAKGTIIILPSADVSDLHGGYNYNNSAPETGWAIGNCDTIFYLNKADPYVAVGTSGRQSASAFTARLNPRKPDVEIYARIAATNTFEDIKSTASLVGTTPSISGSEIIGLAGDNLYYYTNSRVDFFTNAQPDDPYQPYEVKTYPIYTPTPPMLITGTPGNPFPLKAYDVEIGLNLTPSYKFQLTAAGWIVPGSPGAYDDAPDLHLYFGSAIYDRFGPTGGFSRAMAFGIQNVGNQWLDIRVDSVNSNVRYFDLSGPVVSPPSVEGGAHLPLHTSGIITATVKSQVPVGNLTDTLTLKATDPNGNPYVKTIYLHLLVDQKDVEGMDEAWMTAKNPAPPPTLASSPVKTNNTVRLSARAGAPDIDGVKKVWYKIDTNSSDFDETRAAGYRPLTSDGWTEVPASEVDGKYQYNFLVGDVPFPGDDIYYIHWFVETVNTKGSRSGVIGRYDVKRNRPVPTIGSAISIGDAPLTLYIDFAGNALAEDPTADMFSVTNGSVSNINYVSPNRYSFDVLAGGDAGDVVVNFAEAYLRDEYGNWNTAAAPYTLTHSAGIPMVAIFPDSVYFATQTSVQFSVISGLVGDPDLYRRDGTTQIIDLTTAALTYTITQNGSPFTHTFSNFDIIADGGKYTLDGSFTEGEYVLHIFPDTIKNSLGNGIADTIYTFRVYDLALSSTAVTFPKMGEGYPAVTPEPVTITNQGSLTVTGLTVTLTGPDAADFDLHTPPAATLSGGGASTVFTIAPRTGLLEGVYAATAELRSNGNLVGNITLSFTVIVIPQPNAVIDYVNETLIQLHPDTAYVFNSAAPVMPDGGGAVSIPEDWMNDTPDGLVNRKVDPGYGGVLSRPQYITVPSRPAAPAVKGYDTGGTDWNNGEIAGVNDSMEYRLETDDQWLPVPSRMTSLEGLPPGTYLIRYKAIQDVAFSSIIATVTIRVSLTPVITREVNLPDVTDVISEPAPGTHYIDSSDDFGFTLQFGGAPLKVRTSRIVGGQPEELTGVPDGYGGYVYAIRQVKETVYIYIGPETVGNATVDGASVWAYKSVIHVEVLHDEEIDVYAVTGRLVKRVRASEGITSISVAPGVYIVVLKSGFVQKVIVN